MKKSKSKCKNKIKGLKLEHKELLMLEAKFHKLKVMLARDPQLPNQRQLLNKILMTWSLKNHLHREKAQFPIKEIKLLGRMLRVLLHLQWKQNNRASQMLKRKMNGLPFRNSMLYFTTKNKSKLPKEKLKGDDFWWLNLTDRDKLNLKKHVSWERKINNMIFNRKSIWSF